MSINIKKYSYLIYCAIAVIVIISISIVVFLPSANEQPKYFFAEAKKIDLEKTILANGTLQASEQVDVGAQTTGQIKALHISLGQQVKTGDLLAEIDSLTQENTLKEAEAARKSLEYQLQAKQALLKQAKQSFKRQETMLIKGVNSQENFDTAQATLDSTQAEVASLQAQIEQAKIAVDTAQINLNYTKISAPIDGTVVAILYQAGQTVNSVQQAPTIIKLAQLSTMTVEVAISEADVLQVKPEQALYFTILGEPEHRYYASLRAIEPAPESIETESETSTDTSSSAIYYNGLFDVPNPEGKLRISMTAQVTLILNKIKDALTIPRASLMNENPGGTYSIKVLDSAQNPIIKKIQIGIDDGINVEVKSGLKAGEKVIIGEASANINSASASNMPKPPIGF